MARIKLPEGSIAAVETIRKRLDRTMEQFSEDLGYGKSTYGRNGARGCGDADRRPCR